MKKKTIELTQREAILLNIAIHAFSRNYLAENKCRTEKAERNYNNIVTQCIIISQKIESAFGMTTPTDGIYGNNNFAKTDI